MNSTINKNTVPVQINLNNLIIIEINFLIKFYYQKILKCNKFSGLDDYIKVL